MTEQVIVPLTSAGRSTRIVVAAVVRQAVIGGKSSHLRGWVTTKGRTMYEPEANKRRPTKKAPGFRGHLLREGEDINLEEESIGTHDAKCLRGIESCCGSRRTWRRCRFILATFAICMD